MAVTAQQAERSGCVLTNQLLHRLLGGFGDEAADKGTKADNGTKKSSTHTGRQVLIQRGAMSAVGPLKSRVNTATRDRQHSGVSTQTTRVALYVLPSACFLSASLTSTRSDLIRNESSAFVNSADPLISSPLL